MDVEDLTIMFRPPVNRSMQTLDRSFFQKTVQLAAARIFQQSQISACRTALGPDVLRLPRVPAIRPFPQELGYPPEHKALLLESRIRPNDESTWEDRLRALVEEKKVGVEPYSLHLDYSYWDYFDIISSILPEDLHDDLPSGFNIAGHVAHLNLRSRYLPYKSLIATVLMDKNPTIRTVINKVDDVGQASVFRTFDYELLAGDPSLDVEVKEQDCFFKFNYAKVYWNSKLNNEHERLVNYFEPGEAVCDVMAGVGPFAVPAGKRTVFVWANDLNPDSYEGLDYAIQRNKVDQFVQAFNEDGRAFIRRASQVIQTDKRSVDVTPKQKRSSRSAPPAQPNSPESRVIITQPKTFNHYVMNLPASATTFLDAFIGLYHDQEELFAPHTERKLPMIHVHCFSVKEESNEQAEGEICEELSKRLEHTITVDTPDLKIWDVRDVAPKKRMFCASFRLPPEVAFR